MTLTRAQIDTELGNSLGGPPSFTRNNASLDEDLEFMEILMENGDYDYHFSLQSEAAHYLETADITPTQYTLWDRRQNRWWTVAKNLTSFIITVKRRNVGKEDGIVEEQEKNLFRDNIKKLPTINSKVDADFETVTRLRKTIHDLNKSVEKETKKEELETRNSSTPPH